MEAMRNGLGLDTIKVKREELLAKLKENREVHLADFEKAMEGYRITMVDDLKEALNTAKKYRDSNGTVGDPRTRIIFEKPISHADEYDTIIEMLEMSVDDELHITRTQFICYVQDKWAWKKEFVSNTAMYLSKLG